MKAKQIALVITQYYKTTQNKLKNEQIAQHIILACTVTTTSRFVNPSVETPQFNTIWSQLNLSAKCIINQELGSQGNKLIFKPKLTLSTNYCAKSIAYDKLETPLTPIPRWQTQVKLLGLHATRFPLTHKNNEEPGINSESSRQRRPEKLIECIPLFRWYNSLLLEIKHTPKLIRFSAIRKGENKARTTLIHSATKIW